MTLFSQNKKFHIAALILLVSIVFIHFFIVIQYHQLPWYTRLASDLECVYAANTVTVVNDVAPPTHVFYPSATNFAIYGLANRIAALIIPNYHSLLKFKDIDHLTQGIDIMAKANLVNHYCSLLIMIGFVCLMYALLFLLTKHKWLAFWGTLFIATSERVILFNTMLRPELLSIIFFLAAVYLIHRCLEQDNHTLNKTLLTYFGVGICLGLSIFSKIQIGPVLALFVVCFVGYILLSNESKRFPTVDKFWLVSGLALLNIIIFPWWAVQLPAHITPEFIGGDPHSAYRMLYGQPPSPESWHEVPLKALFLIFIVTLLVVVFNRGKRNSMLSQKIDQIVLFINLIVFGVIISIYTLCIPYMSSWQGYLDSTQTIVYSTFSNVLRGSFIENRSFGINNFLAIYDQLSVVPFFIFNLFHLVVIGFIISAFRILKPNTVRKKYYVYALLWLVGGLAMDVMSSVREQTILWWYTVYAISLYGVGLVMIIMLEFDRLNKYGFQKIERSMRYALIIFMTFHLGVIYKQFQNEMHERKVTLQSASYHRDYESCAYQADGFWNHINKQMYDSKDFQTVRTLGQKGVWRGDFEFVKAQLNLMAQSNPEDYTDFKKGQVDQLIEDYVFVQKTKAYFYDYHNSLGKYFLNKKDFIRAFMNYNLAIEVQPEFGQAYSGRAAVYYIQKEYEECLKDLQTAQRLGYEVNQKLLKSLSIKKKVD